jgi:hypothetical protein
MQTVYLLSDPRTGAPRYVGITGNLKRRIYDHLHGRNDGHCKNWIRSLRELGLAPKVETLDTVDDHERQDYERAWILGFRIAGANLTNLTIGGDGSPGCRPSLEARAKKSLKSKAMWSSGEFRKKMSLAHQGNSAALGYKHSKETRAKNSKAQTGRKHSAESKAKMSTAKRGYKFSAEARAKMSTAKRGHKYNVGRVLSPETRAKIGAAQKAYRLAKRTGESQCRLS